ncbi:hypothetical protein ACWA50_10625 [Testudinibacter sp. P17/SS/0325]
MPSKRATRIAVRANKNYFSTGTLTTENIENHSEVSMQSVSGGLSTDMGNLAMAGMSAEMSALGNVSKDDSTTTQSAVSQNINLDVRNGEIPTALLYYPSPHFSCEKWYSLRTRRKRSKFVSNLKCAFLLENAFSSYKLAGMINNLR